MTEARPHVSINMAMTLDGKVMRPDGRWYGLSSPADRARMDVYRAQADALIVGRNSIDRDDPVVKPRTDGPHPVPVLVCRTALPPHNRRIFQDEAHRALVFTTEQLAGYGRATGLYGSAEFVGFAAAELGPSSVLRELTARGLLRVLLEGGPRLNYAFFADDLVDVLYLTIVPFLIGQSDLPGIVDGVPPFPDFDRRGWLIERSEAVASELFLKYVRQR